MGQSYWGNVAQDSRAIQARLDELEKMIVHLRSDAGNFPNNCPDLQTSTSAVPDSQSRFDARSLGERPLTSFPTGRAKMVRNLLRKRRHRDVHFGGDIFADPAWDMLLDLYAAHYERRNVSVSSLCIAAAVPATTALRWIKMMTDTGMFLREADPDDGRRIYLRLSESSRIKMDAYFADIEEKWD